MKTPNPPQTPISPKTPSTPEISISSEVPQVPQAHVSPSYSTTSSEQSDDKLKGFKPMTVFQQQIGVNSLENEDETIIGDLLRNTYFRVNQTGAFIWRQIEKQSRFCDIVKSLSEEYNINYKFSEEVLTKFLSDIIEAGLITSSTSTDDEERL